jgi:hypothetical protein
MLVTTIGHIDSLDADWSKLDDAELMRMHDVLITRVGDNFAVEKLRQLQAFERRLDNRRVHARELQEQRANSGDSAGDATALLASRTTADRLEALRAEMLRRAAALEAAAADTSTSAAAVSAEERRLLRRRALALRQQQEQIGAVLARLALERARQLADTEAADAALATLNACMIDELNERATAGNNEGKPDARQMLEAHGVQVANIDDQLGTQKQKADVQLRLRLQERARRRHDAVAKVCIGLSQGINMPTYSCTWPNVSAHDNARTRRRLPLA